MSVSASEPIRLASASDVPGLKTIPRTREPSLKAGRNALGKNGTLAAAPATAKAAAQSSILVRDRKSTRLNSSHLVISYAVFCLKKKKKNDTSKTYHTIT